MNQNSYQPTPVTRELEAKNIAYRVFTHAGPVHSLEQAARERGQRPEQVVRSIVFRISGDEFVMVLTAGSRQISWPRLRECLGVTRMSMASPEEVLEQTGYLPGAVSPFGLAKPMRVLVDEAVLEEEEVSIGSGVRNTTVFLRTEELKKVLGQIEVGAFIDG